MLLVLEFVVFHLQVLVAPSRPGDNQFFYSIIQRETHVGGAFPEGKALVKDLLVGQGPNRQEEVA